LLDGIFPSTQSTVLNVELLSDSGKIISRKIIPIAASTAANAIELPSNLMQGSYTITAFTSLMMNFGTANFYNKQINIYNTENSGIEKKVAYLPEINFLPESGNLVAGFQNTIAFKCTDNNGFPLSVNGTIVNSEAKVQASFASNHDGMGKFELLPTLGEKYFAECVIDGVLKKRVALPEVIYNTTLMKITKSNAKVFLEINSSNVNSEVQKPAYILAVEENMVAFKIPLSADKLVTKAELPVNDLPTGILKITLFNKDNQPLAERLLFVNTGDYEIKTSITANNINTGTRKKNDLIINIGDTAIVGSYSIAITNADIEIDNIDGKDNIVSRFLLTDNLKGKINNPAYYFEKNDEAHANNIDLVMLTSGWRRYSWTEIMTNRFPTMVFKDPNYISFTGTAGVPFTKNLLFDTELMAFVKTKNSLPDFLNTKTDKQGVFEFSGLLFEDTARFFIQNAYGKDKRINLKLTSPSLSGIFTISKKNIPYFNFTKPSLSQNVQISKMHDLNLLNQKNIKLLEAINLTTKVKTKAELFEKDHVRSILGNNSSHTLNFLSDPPRSGVNILEYLKSKLNGVSISGGPLNYVLNYRGTRSLSGGPIPMSIYLDDFLVDASQIASMQASDFALVKVFPSGPLSGVGGSLSLYTDKERKGTSNASSHVSEAVIEGFSITKEFFSPNYDLPTSNDGLGDNRTTLYWNPYLTADAFTKQIKLSFFNNDSAKKFKIIVEGFTKQGGLVHLEKVVE
jgi:hypothetical protein